MFFILPLCYHKDMYIATVIPIKKGLQKEYLTYFSADLVPLGMIVTVPVRSSTIDAIVIAMDDVRSMKSDIKSAEYQLKKIIRIKGPSPFTAEFFTACTRMKDYTLSTTGVLIKALLPSVFLENIPLLKTPPEQEHADLSMPSTIGISPKHEKLIFQALTSERIAFYRTLIREAFAKKESVFICVPTRYDIEDFKQILSKGIEQYVFVFQSSMTKKTLLAHYNECVHATHPVLIISTGTFLSIPRADIKTIILEHESSESYKQLARPFIDIRTFAEILSSVQKSKLILGDTLLRPETLYRHEQGEFGEVASPLFRLPSVERQLVVDMKEELDERGAKRFTVLSDTTKKMIEYALTHGESVFLFSVRKGLAGVTVCHDCGYTLLCPQCATPMVLYGSKQRTATRGETSNRIFMCNKCGLREATEVTCAQCGSWNLTPLGIGTDRVYQEVKNLFPEASIIQIDKEATPTEKEARSEGIQFSKTRGSILIGTEMAFSYIDRKVVHSAIISLDGLLSIPSFNITQKILHIIEKLHFITERNLIIQTRTPDNRILEHILSGNVLPLYREDLRERKQFGYPPFKRLIKITFAGTAIETDKARKYLDHRLEGYDPQIFSAFVGKVRGNYVTNTVIKIDPERWGIPLADNSFISDQTLLGDLSSLPPVFSINVDPEDLL
jgi:primosomal protein N' (replication factor Y) (superfamily II helicase)